MSASDLEIAPWSIVPSILKILEIGFPDSLAAYQTLTQYTQWKTKDLPDLKVMLLTPGGKVDEFGTFILCAIEHRHIMCIYSLNNDMDKIKSLILNTKHIPWDQGPIWCALHEKYYPTIFEICAIKNLKRVVPDHKSSAFVMDKELAKKIEIICPPEVYLKELKPEEAELIDSYWPHRGKGSLEVGRFMIKYNGSVGLHDKETNELIAWAFITTHNGPGQLFVLDKHKRKGYGTLVAKAITKLVAEKNVTPVAFIVETNISSQNLFLKIGYKKLWKVHWCCAISE